MFGLHTFAIERKELNEWWIVYVDWIDYQKGNLDSIENKPARH